MSPRQRATKQGHQGGLREIANRKPLEQAQQGASTLPPTTAEGRTPPQKSLSAESRGEAADHPGRDLSKSDSSSGGGGGSRTRVAKFNNTVNNRARPAANGAAAASRFPGAPGKASLPPLLRRTATDRPQISGTA